MLGGHLTRDRKNVAVIFLIGLECGGGCAGLPDRACSLRRNAVLRMG